jgi:hypothetical protein
MKSPFEKLFTMSLWSAFGPRSVRDTQSIADQMEPVEDQRVRC